MLYDHDYIRNPELTDAQISVFQFTSPHPQITEDFVASVVKVTDGDTVTLRAGFRDFDFPLRLSGIDAPELNAGGEEAKEYLKTRVEGSECLVVIDGSNRVGRYGRLVGDLVVDGQSLSDEMVSLGLVREFDSRDDGVVPSFDKLVPDFDVYLLREVDV